MNNRSIAAANARRICNLAVLVHGCRSSESESAVIKHRRKAYRKSPTRVV